MPTFSGVKDAEAPLRPVDWDQFVLSQEHGTAYHLQNWANLLQCSLGHRAFYLTSRGPSGELDGLLPLVQVNGGPFGRSLVSLPAGHAGVLARSEAALHDLLAQAEGLRRTLKARYVEIRQCETFSFPGLVSRQPKEVYSLALPAVEEEMWARIGGKCRNLVRKAEKSGLSLAGWPSPRGVEAFYSVYARNMRDIGVPVLPRNFFTLMEQRLSDNVHFLIIEKSGSPVAAACLLTFRNRVEVPFASALREHFACSPNMLLYWECLRWAIRGGCAVFDFGRSSPGSRTAQFKRQWGAQPEPLYYHRMSSDPSQAPVLSSSNRRLDPVFAVWKRLPLSLTNAIGPTISRWLPW